MALERPRNRWTIAVAAVVMQICLGAAYGWSVFVRPLMGMTGWTLTQVSLNFTLAIAFLRVGTIIGGLWQDRVGPRPVATVAGVLYGLSYLHMGGIYGWILLAWGLGAIPSPILIARLRQTTGRYDQAIYILGVVLLVSAVLPLLAKPPGRPVAARFEGGRVTTPGDRTEA